MLIVVPSLCSDASKKRAGEMLAVDDVLISGVGRAVREIP
jgi:hypothetical protein